MKLTIERSDLLNALSHVQNVVERRNTIPILSNVLIEAKGAEVTFVATDLDIEAVDSADARVSSEGAITAPAGTLFDVVRKLPAGADVELELNPENRRLSIRSGRSQFALPTLPATDFQTMTGDDAAIKFDVEAAGLRRLIDKTRFAISTEETRYYLNGVYMHVAEGDAKKKVLRAVATDGHRLALADTPAPKGSEGLQGVIVPRKAIAEVRRLIDQTDNDVSIAVSETKIVFRAGRAVLTSKLIDGTFPDYERVIPQDNDKELMLECAAFGQAVDRVATIATEKSRAVKINLEGERLTLTVINPDTGTAAEDMVVSYQDDAMEIGFNSRYLLDVMAQIKGGEAKLVLKDSASPTIITDAADDTQSALYVLMPMRV